MIDETRVGTLSASNFDISEAPSTRESLQQRAASTRENTVDDL